MRLPWRREVKESEAPQTPEAKVDERQELLRTAQDRHCEIFRLLWAADQRIGKISGEKRQHKEDSPEWMRLTKEVYEITMQSDELGKEQARLEEEIMELQEELNIN